MYATGACASTATLSVSTSSAVLPAAAGAAARGLTIKLPCVFSRLACCSIATPIVPVLSTCTTSPMLLTDTESAYTSAPVATLAVQAVIHKPP